MSPAPLLSPSTKDRILDAAESLFAEIGFDATSLRAITSRAAVNLAAVNYHFKSKEALLHAVYARRAQPVNRRRLELLEAYLASVPSGAPLPNEPILDAFFRPLFELGEIKSNIPRLMVRLFYFESGELFRRVFESEFRPVMTRFLEALKRALPQLPDQEIFWRMQFVFGAFAHVIAGTQALQVLTEGRVQPSLDKTLHRLIHFASAGLSAPVHEGTPCNLPPLSA